jgi:triphosphoribosyl-dephospho-CoA synthase
VIVSILSDPALSGEVAAAGSGMIDRIEPHIMAGALVFGARAELDLTPKPGLVDRYDNGSHPDLDHTRMVRSIELLPRYYQELIGIRSGADRRAASSLAACIDAGRRAEARMEEAIGTNTHRGYIFLSGLLLLAVCDVASGDGIVEAIGPQVALRRAVVSVARQFFAANRRPGADRPGARVRAALGLGGVRAEALAGLPAVFAAGLPAYLAARSDFAAFHALAALMQNVEDTTAVLRCGLAGLGRLRGDGAVLQALLDRGDDPRPVLSAWNEEYRTQRLTMGGVADCLALVFALASVRERVGIP